jgi:hypothetical protein
VHCYNQAGEKFVIGLRIEEKFVRPSLDPGSVLGALPATGKKFLISSAYHVNISHSITPGVPSDRRLAFWVPRGDWVGVRPKNRSGDRVIR